MEFEEFIKFVDVVDEKLIERSEPSVTNRERILSRTVKISEEFGELCDEVLAFGGDQRKEKLDKKGEDSLPHEFADVLMTLFLLAKSMNVDVLDGVEKKMEKIRNRLGIEEEISDGM